MSVVLTLRVKNHHALRDEYTARSSHHGARSALTLRWEYGFPVRWYRAYKA